MEKQKDVSIAMLTYFHENYVAQALDSILSQKTTYSFEIVISDDGSTDRTREILEDYQKKYPDIIILNFNEKNVGLTKNYYAARSLCTGRYIAGISGDDYWIDDGKIQYQVDFLDANPDYYAVGCCIEGRFDNDVECFAIYPKKKYRNKTITLEDYLNGAMFGTNGMMIRNPFLTEDGKAFFSTIPKASPYIDDATECILVLSLGSIYIFDRKSVVYRVQRDTKNKHNFNSIHTTLEKCRKSIDLYNNLFALYNSKLNLFNLYKDHIAIALLQSIITNDIEGFRDIYKTVPEEYRNRGLLIKSLPNVFKVGTTKIKNTILAIK